MKYPKHQEYDQNGLDGNKLEISSIIQNLFNRNYTTQSTADACNKIMSRC